MSSWRIFQRKLDRVLEKYREGDCVELENCIRGCIRYIGARKFYEREGVWLGIETEFRGDGESDGVFDSVDYFEASKRSALLVRPRDIIRIIPPIRSPRFKRASSTVSYNVQRKWFDKRAGNLSDSEFETSRGRRMRRRRGSRRERSGSPREGRGNDRPNYTDFVVRCRRILRDLYERGDLLVDQDGRLTLAGCKSLLMAWRRCGERDISSRDTAIDLLLEQKPCLLLPKLKDMSDSELDSLMTWRNKKSGFNDMYESRSDEIDFEDFTTKLQRKGFVMTTPNVQDVFNCLDAKRKGYITYRDFADACPRDGDIESALDNILTDLRQRRQGNSKLDHWVEDGWSIRNMDRFRDGIKRLGIRLNRSESENLWNNIDTWRRGYIYWYEFARRLPTDISPDNIIYKDLVVKNINVDEDGYVNLDEFIAYMKKNSRDISKRECRRLFEAIDRKGRGEISMSDFQRLAPSIENVARNMERVMQRVRSRKIDLFKEIDKNNSMCLSFKEFTEFLRDQGVKLSKKRMSEVFNRIDTNEDGMIELKEFEDACPDDGNFVDFVMDLADGRRSTWDHYDRKKSLQRYGNGIDEALGDPMRWSELEVRDWVSSLRNLTWNEQKSLGKVFLRAHVDGPLLLSLTKHDLKRELGLCTKELEVVVDGIERLKQQCSDAKKVDAASWSISQVQDWLERQDFSSRVKRLFRRGRVEGEALQDLTISDLKDLRINARCVQSDVLDARDELFASKPRKVKFALKDNKTVREWNWGDVVEWARKLGFDPLIFRGIRGSSLLKMDSQELRIRGVDSKHRDAILHAIKKLRLKAPTNEVDFKEFWSKLRRRFPGLHKREAKRYFEKIDIDGKGVIDWDDCRTYILLDARNLRELSRIVPEYVSDLERLSRRGGRRSRRTDPYTWCIDETMNWLERRGYGRHIPRFELYRIDGEKLSAMSESYLKRIDNSISSRKRLDILDDIQDLFDS